MDGDDTRAAIRVHGRYLARAAARILRNPSPTHDDVELLRDGDSRGATYYNRAGDGSPRVNWYGYGWDRTQRVAALV